ncbi:MAG: chemotaxis protein CheA [Desulfuromonas sp.]|nr:MAG: chemotaxis protein CheA [Desulfuromonas sp.]
MIDKILETFREEFDELLVELEHSLLELEDNPADTDAIDSVFRSLHTIKGSSAMAGVDIISNFVHEIETAFELVRDGELQVTRNLINQTLAAKDLLKSLAHSLDDDEPAEPAGMAEIIQWFTSVIPKEETTAPTASDETLSVEGATTFRIRFRPAPDIFCKGLNPLFIVRELKQLGSCLIVPQLDEIPPLEELKEEFCYLYWDIILTTNKGVDAIYDMFMFVEDHCTELKVDPIDDGGTLDLEDEYKRLGEILVERGDIKPEELTKALQGKKQLGEELVDSGLVTTGKVEAALTEQQRVKDIRQVRKQTEISSSIRVRSEKLDKLVNLIGEMVTVQARLSQHASGDVDSELHAISEVVERLTWELRDEVLNIRMLPIGTTFNRFRRLVRDLCAELDKDINLVTEGAETELDKTVIERLNDPLVHLIRNCIDHGIESTAERSRSDKPATGTVRLTAKHSGANVILTIADDGRGFDREAVRQRAVSQGLLAQDVELSDKDLFNLIFLPGFSTADTVTNVSGRGVGMDVVKRSIEELRGSIEAHSEPGKGVKFSIKLPLTLAIIDGLLVNIAGESYVFPLSSVEECVELKRKDVAANDRNLANVRGEIVPYVHLREYFSLADAERDIEQIVIINHEGARVGFVVDHVIGEHQTVIKSLGKMYQGISGLSGATILGDGKVALILDLPQIVEAAALLEEAV